MQETKTVLVEVKETIAAAAEVIYTQKRHKRLLSRRKKANTTG